MSLKDPLAQDMGTVLTVIVVGFALVFLAVAVAVVVAIVRAVRQPRLGQKKRASSPSPRRTARLPVDPGDGDPE